MDCIPLRSSAPTGGSVLQLQHLQSPIKKAEIVTPERQQFIFLTFGSMADPIYPPFEDTDDFDKASQGLIDSLEHCVIYSKEEPKDRVV